MTDAALRAVVAGYTREAGVRSLERELARLLRKAAAKVAEGPALASVPDTVGQPESLHTTPARSLRIDEGDLHTWLGRPRHQSEVAERTSVPGVATGLAVTGVGGDVLFVEASAAPGEPGLTITGQLGEVMQESAQIALSYVRAHAPNSACPRTPSIVCASTCTFRPEPSPRTARRPA